MEETQEIDIVVVMPAVTLTFPRIPSFPRTRQLLYLMAVMIFCWSLFDSILSYILPILIVERGFSQTQMGLIIGSSSLAGAVFDLILGRYLKRPDFRRIFLSMFLLSLSFLLLLISADGLWMYFAAMAVWGLYWDLYGFGNANFVTETHRHGEFAAAFGIINVFKSVGLLLAPLIAGSLFHQENGHGDFMFAGLMLALGFVMFVILLTKTRRHTPSVLQVRHTASWVHSFSAWGKIGRQILPVLVLIFLFFLNNAFFWTVGPLISERLGSLGVFEGIFLVAYLLPALISGWLVGPLAAHFGQKRTAFGTMLIGSLLVTLLAFVTQPWLLVMLVAVSAFFISLSLPAISGAVADYMAETPGFEKEIQALSDLFYNLAWVIGPISAGLLSDKIGNLNSFGVLGAFSVVVAVILFKVTPRRIKVKIK